MFESGTGGSSGTRSTSCASSATCSAGAKRRGSLSPGRLAEPYEMGLVEAAEAQRDRLLIAGNVQPLVEFAYDTKPGVTASPHSSIMRRAPRVSPIRTARSNSAACWSTL